MILIYAVIHEIKKFLVDLDKLFMVEGPVVHPGFIHFYKSEEEFFTKDLFIKEGLKLSVIARALNLPAHQPGRMLQRVFTGMEEAMRAAGMPADYLRDLLAEVQW